MFQSFFVCLRYYYNETHVLVMVDDEVYVSTIQGLDLSIDKILKQQLQLYILFLRWLDLYDESNDSVLHFVALKVKNLLKSLK